MFYLSLIEHTLRLPPHLLSLSQDKAVRHELENLFLDKVCIGACICSGYSHFSWFSVM